MFQLIKKGFYYLFICRSKTSIKRNTCYNKVIQTNIFYTTTIYIHKYVVYVGFHTAQYTIFLIILYVCFCDFYMLRMYIDIIVFVL